MIMTYPCFVILTAGRRSFTKKQMLRCRQDDKRLQSTIKELGRLNDFRYIRKKEKAA